MTSELQTATAVQQLDTHAYNLHLTDGWTIGPTPHGGYVLSCVLTAIQKHFATTLAKYKQPHTIAVQSNFLGATRVGNALLHVQDVKLGRQSSVVHVTVEQDGKRKIVAYITNSNLDTESGVSFETDWQSSADAATSPMSPTTGEPESRIWKEWLQGSTTKARGITQKVRSWYRSDISVTSGVVESWLCLNEDAGRWNNESIGLLVDYYPPIIEGFLGRLTGKSVQTEGREQLWYPTLLLNFEVKKSLPKEGVRFLRSRLQAKQIKNGRFDMELILFDETNDMVALSNHIVLAIAVRSTGSIGAGNKL